MGELAKRRIEASSRISQMQTELVKSEEAIRGAACVYATGSFGRQEADPASDLDLFIVRSC